MRSSTSDSPARRSPLRRRGSLTGQLVLFTAVAGAASIGSAVWYIRPFSGATEDGSALVERVVRGTFEHDIVERGELESSNNVLVRCEVQSRTTGTNGVKIIEIVPEGTVVKTGDSLIRFDDAALQAERTTQLINVGSAEAAAAQSQNDLETAVISRKEYEFGEFETEREKILGEKLVASQATIHAEESVAHSKKMLRRGYIPKLQLQSDEFRLAKAQSDLRAAEVKFHALVEYTRPKKISELDSKVKTSEAKLKSDEAKLALERQKLQVLDEQIAKCVVKAPVDGQVIYDHERDDWGGSEYQIKQGAVIHEQRVVIRLPDPKKMQVVAKVAEARIDRIKVGMPAKFEVEGLPDVKLTGKVTRVNEYPASENWFNATVKEYATTVEVFEPPAGLRPGMTAKVAIRVETIADALQVPIQSVVEREGKYYCLRRSGAAIEPCEVVVGATNEKFIVIRDGVKVDDEVLLNPRARLADVNMQDAALIAQAHPDKPRQGEADRKPTGAPGAAGGAGS
ncbi:MAG: HlyD family efflux transporter periplasmic adaptor subunit [Pirellulales bacterium]